MLLLSLPRAAPSLCCSGSALFSRRQLEEHQRLAVLASAAQQQAELEQEQQRAARVAHERELSALQERLASLSLALTKPSKPGSYAAAAAVMPAVAAAVARPTLSKDQVEYFATQLAELQSSLGGVLAEQPMSSTMADALSQARLRCDMLMSALLGAS